MIENLSITDLATASATLWAVGLLTYTCREVPHSIYKVALRCFTTTMTFHNGNQSYYDFMLWYSKLGHMNTARNLQVDNGIWGVDSNTVGLGEGTQYFRFNGKTIRLILSIEVSGSLSSRPKCRVDLRILGRSHATFDLIREGMKEVSSEEEGLELQEFSDGGWGSPTRQPHREFSTIHLNLGVKERILGHLDRFLESEDWYVDRGIPYQTGVLLHGPPGTGKTSVIRAMAHYLDYRVCHINSGSLADLEKAIRRLPKKSIIVIEDVDAEVATSKRVDGDEDGVCKNPITFTSLSDLLNAIDGVNVTHGRVLVMTTNFRERLDGALLRPGRIDLDQEIGYLDEYAFRSMLETSYPGVQLPKHRLCFYSDKITAAEVQGCILEHKSDCSRVLARFVDTSSALRA